MSIKLVDTLESMGNFPVANADGIQFTDGESLQKKLDDGSLGSGGSSYTELSQQEYDDLSDETKLDGTEYRTYDTGNIYKNGVLYGEKKAIELTYDEYKALEEAGKVEADVNYIVIPNDNGTLLEATDVAYSNTLSGLEATNLQGAVDAVSEKIDGLVNDDSVSSDTVWSSSKVSDTLPLATGLRNVDLNDITANGTYTIGVPSSIENIPDTRGYGILSVFKGEKDIANSGYVMQLYFLMYDNTVYLRSRIETGVWKDWVQLVVKTAANLSIDATSALQVKRNSVTPAFINFMDVYGNLYTLQCGDQANRFYVLRSAVSGNYDIPAFSRTTDVCYFYSQTYVMTVLQVVGDLSVTQISKSSIPSTVEVVDIA